MHKYVSYFGYISILLDIVTLTIVIVIFYTILPVIGRYACNEVSVSKDVFFSLNLNSFSTKVKALFCN